MFFTCLFLFLEIITYLIFSYKIVFVEKLPYRNKTTTLMILYNVCCFSILVKGKLDIILL
jgi:hypothetical protein